MNASISLIKLEIVLLLTKLEKYKGWKYMPCGICHEGTQQAPAPLKIWQYVDDILDTFSNQRHMLHILCADLKIDLS